MFVPGNQERRIGKAVSIPADAVILDLEDSVPAAEKETARSMLPGAISRFHAVAKQVFVRVNSMVTPDCAPDIKIAVASGITGIVLPKSESAAVLKHAGAMVTAAEEISGIDAGRTHIIPLVETPKGLININEIAGALPRIIGIAFGGEDYALEMGITRTRE